MTALTANKDVPRMDTPYMHLPVEAAVRIYKGGIVNINAAGYAVPGADTNGHRFAGIAYEEVDNTVSGNSQGGKSVKVYKAGTHKLVATGVTQAMLGQPMYVKDDATVDDTSTNYIMVGRMVEFISTTSVWVDIGQRQNTIENAPGRLYKLLTSGQDNLGALDYGDLTIAGTSTGHTYGRGSWMNLASGAILAAGHIHVPWEGGIYDAGATLTNARIVFGAQYQSILASAPDTMYCWRLNVAAAGGAITALIAAANPGSVGYQADAAETATKLGDIPIADIVGTGVVYARVYDGRN